MPEKRKDLMQILNYFHFDLWTLWGFAAQGIFFLSFFIQWYKSEKLKTSVVPMEFWYLRILGALMSLFYFIQRRDIVFCVSMILQVVIYSRNIHLVNFKASAGKE